LTQSAIGKTAHEQGEDSTKRTQLWLEFILAAGWTSGSVGLVAAQEQGLLFAHGGGSLEFEENTMEGFRGTYEKGLRGFESWARGNTAPRGLASTIAGDKTCVIDVPAARPGRIENRK
jgi:hypothetical protein